MFHLLASIVEVLMIAYTVWVVVNLKAYKNTILSIDEDEHEEYPMEAKVSAGDRFANKLMIPVQFYQYLKYKAFKLLKSYGLY